MQCGTGTEAMNLQPLRRCMRSSDRLQHHHQCQKGFAPVRQSGNPARLRHVGHQHAFNAGISCLNIGEEDLSAVRSY